MPSRQLDVETLREVFVYLYRCWLHKYLGQDPIRLGLSATDGALIAQGFSLYYSVEGVTDGTLADLKARLQQPLFLFAPVFPRNAIGAASFDRQAGLPAPFAEIIAVINDHWAWLREHKERALTRNEAYERLDHGHFDIWRSSAATRLILQPASASVYGYVVVRNGPRDYFFRKSKSCKEEGRRIAQGQYKRTQHRQEAKSYVNFDLLMDKGEVLLLHLAIAGAGYKAFPRQTPEPEFGNL